MVRRTYGLAVALAALMAVLCVLAAATLGLPLRDPDGFLGPSWVRLPLIVGLGLLADIVPRGLYRARGFRGLIARCREVARERWTRNRVGLVVAGVGSFYLTYVGYRNLKSFLPWVREHTYDTVLGQSDRILALGNEPAELLHTVLGTGITAHVLSFIYLGYLMFVPVSMAAWLVWSRNVTGGLWYCTALCVNWVLGLASYYMIPSQGPFVAQPSMFWDLPDTGVSALQTALVDSRHEVINDPTLTESIQSIAGFASLHVSVVFTAALITHMTIKSQFVRWAMWAFLVATVVSTIYFGWHYVADDIAGFAIGGFAVWVSALATGHNPRGNYRGQIFGGGDTVEPSPEPVAGLDRQLQHAD